MPEKGLYINSTQFVPLSQIKDNLTSEIATRQFALGGWPSFFGQLPDPDPILRNLGIDQMVYDDLLADSRIGSMVDRRKNQTKSMDWDIDRSDGAGGKEVELCESILRHWEDNDVSIKDLISQSLNPIFFGYSVFEIIWGQVNGYWLPVKVEEKPREWFFYDNKNQLRFRSVDSWEGIVIRGEEADPKIAAKFIVLVNDYSYKNPYGKKALSRCWWPATFKRGGFKLFAEFLERFGMPFIYGKLPRSASADQHNELFSQLSNFIQGAVGTGPDDSSVQLIEMKGGSGSSDLYDKFLDRCDNAISEAILTNSLSTSIQRSGARASSETGANTIEGNLGQEDKDFPIALFNKIFKRTIDINIGSKVYPQFKTFEEEEVNKDLSERDKNLSEIGVAFNKKYFANNYNIAEDEFELKEKPAAVPPINQALNNKMPVDQVIPKNELSSFKRLLNRIIGKIDLSKASPSAAEAIMNAIPAKALQYGIEQTLKPVIDLAQKSNSREELLNSLASLYPGMKTDALEELLMKAILIADMQGMLDANKEN